MTRLSDITKELCERAVALGADTVIVMVSAPDGAKHSQYYVESRGRCINVRGLLETAGDAVRGAIVYNDYSGKEI